MTIDQRTGAPYGIAPRLYADAQRELACHALETFESRSWRCAKPGTGIWSFTVTWSPGNLSLAGDLGELQIVHYHAMRTWQAAVGWMAGADYSYIMEKCPGVTEEFDAEATYKALVLEANEQGMAEWYKEHRDAVRDWHGSMSGMNAPGSADVCGRIVDWYGIGSDDIGPHWEPRPTFHDTCPKIDLVDSWSTRKSQRWHLPDGCDLWHAIFQKVLPHLDPNKIFKARYRAMARYELRRLLADMDLSGAYRFLGELQNDPSPATRYPRQTQVQYLALQWWAAQVQAEMSPTDDVVGAVTAG